MNTTIDSHPEQEVFILFLLRTPNISPAIRLEDDGEYWQAKLHHISSGNTIEIPHLEGLSSAIQHYFETQNPTPLGRVGLK